VEGDDNNNCIFITREYDSSDLKENGTIPFYAIFFHCNAGTGYAFWAAMNANQRIPARNVPFECTGVVFPCQYMRTARIEFRCADGSTGFVWVNRSLPAQPAPRTNYRSRVIQPLLTH
jgi:hypothetical protein